MLLFLPTVFIIVALISFSHIINSDIAKRMDLFKRIGTDRHKFKLEFFLKTLACNAKLKGDIYIKIKRGDHKITSQNKVPLEDDGKCNFGREILTFQSLTLFFDPDKKAYQEKEGEFTVVIITKKGEKKLLGSFEFDVAEYANSGKQNIQVSKKFGDKIKVVLEYDVFIKCLGEASQTSKSVDKQPERKKQSSLSKFTSLFTGGKQSPEKEQKNASKEKKNVEEKNNRKQRETSNPKNIGKQVNNVFKSKNEKVGKEAEREKEKADERTAPTNLGKRTENTGSERKITEKPKKKKNDSEEDNLDDSPEKESKNLVNIRQKNKDNYTQIEQSQADANSKIKNKKNSTPLQEPIYFDQVKKRTGQADDEPEFRPNRMKRTENIGFNKQPTQVSGRAKVKQFQPVDNSEQIERLNKQMKELSGKNTDLEKQNRELRAQNMKLSQQNQKLAKKLQQGSKNARNNDFFQTERDGGVQRKDDERVKNLQKEKGELLLKIQKLEQKYKKDFQKYEERVEQYEEEKTEAEEASKAEIKRLKDQFSEQKDKYDKLMSKYEEKANEFKQFKQKENDLKQKLAIAQNNLSELKLKIGDQLNEANEQGNKTVIDVLTLLSE